MKDFFQRFCLANSTFRSLSDGTTCLLNYFNFATTYFHRVQDQNFKCVVFLTANVCSQPLVINECVTTDQIVALKRLKMEKEKDGFPITSLREINTLLKSQHVNIVTVRVGHLIDVSPILYQKPCV